MAPSMDGTFERDSAYHYLRTPDSAAIDEHLKNPFDKHNATENVVAILGLPEVADLPLVSFFR
jgi:hypothetical protein